MLFSRTTREAFHRYFAAAERGDSIAKRQPLLDAYHRAVAADRGADPDADPDAGLVAVLRQEIAALRRELGLAPHA